VSCRVRFAANNEWLAAHALDLSRVGMALVLPQQLTAGQLLIIELRRSKPDVFLTMLLRAVYAYPLPSGSYRVGGQFFRELAPTDLERMLS
jgi:hypothetical protein